MAADGALHIELADDCDPATFNAAGGPGTCRGDGDTTVAQFLAELHATRIAEAWVFDPSRATVRRSQTVVAHNVGGEPHTFTCVTNFGGGVVPILNQVSGNTTPAVVCASDSFGKSLVLSGGSRTLNLSNFQQASPGGFQFECLIHPWMRTTLRVGRDQAHFSPLAGSGVRGSMAADHCLPPTPAGPGRKQASTGLGYHHERLSAGCQTCS